MPQPIKILVTIPFFYPNRGGTEKYTEELYTQLKKAQPDMHIDILCYNSTNAKSTEVYRGLNIYRIPCYTLLPGKFLLPKFIPLIMALFKLRSNKYNFVNSHTAFFDTTWWAWMFAKSIGAKSIFTGHAPGHPTHQTKTAQLIGKLVHITLGKWALKKYDILTYANRKSKDFFENTFGVKKGGEIIHIAIDNSVYKKATALPQHPLAKSSYIKAKDDILITYIGRMIETKGVNYLYQAILQLRQMLPETVWNKQRFMFAGPGPLNEYLNEFIKKDSLDRQVFLLGDVTPKQVAEILSVSDIFVSPSSHSEGLPNTILEAGASGCFVIATDSGSIGDIVIDKRTGLLIPMKSVFSLSHAMLWVLNNQDQAAKLSENMTQMILQEFTWNKTAQTYFELLNENLS